MSHHNEKVKDYWEQELEKPSLVEPPFKSKLHWMKPLTVFHSLEFKGLDKRDQYEPHNYDAWDHMAWNTPNHQKFDKKCADYYLDLHKCQRYLKVEFPFMKTSYLKRTDYCWKMQDNYANCKRVFIRKNRKFVNDSAVFPEDH